ncbi:MAG: FAD-binding oxidoreductase [Rhodanobacter sp.]
MNMTAPAEATIIIERLRSEWGEPACITDPDELLYYSQDVYSQGEPLLAVLRPRTSEQLAPAVAALTAAGVAIIARGGGMSYTEGYLATRQPTVLVDTSGLDRIVEINVQDAYVVVEAGVTWAQLHAALAEHDVRTPYFGPMSGLRATVGGALSQGSAFHGSGRYGSSGDAVLGVEVLTAAGDIVRTGAAASGNSAPFFRYFGPDLTGLFLGDCGLLGIKLRASLRLLPRHSQIDYLSWQFRDAAGLTGAMGALARAGLPSEVAAFDPKLSQIRMRRASLGSDVKTLGNVIKKGGLMQGLKLVAKGRNFLDPEQYSLHVTVEGDSAAEVVARVVAAHKLVAPFGEEVENSIPKVMAANPFSALNSMLGSGGERWVPIHAIVPHSQATSLLVALDALFAAEQAMMDRHGLFIGTLMTTIGAQAILIETCVYWPDSHTEFHRRNVEADHRARIGCTGENLPARAAADVLKRKIADTMRGLGGVHFQIGKFYAYRAGRDPIALALLDAVKRQLDPQGLMNPGVLA